ncbi:hypothetical protein PV327_006326 [Microctonus hyperodae]|uniref:DM13 domain-containing protein n=1 Tax=Microctonus hyperodae TaxID=165561 RepID=A0AA39F416_MICHY|nr:hypothetical protein PV327_006326 [Microctonus hyperodae]
MERMNNLNSTSIYKITKLSKFNFFILLIFLFSLNIQIGSGEYYGKLIGKLSELHHGVSGQVYAVDSKTIFIKDFTYDGEGPAAYFYAGNSRGPVANGFKIRDEKGILGPLKKYNRRGITLSLPDGKSLNNIRWFSVYCDDYSIFSDMALSYRKQKPMQ